MYDQTRKTAHERKTDIIGAISGGGWFSAGQIAKAIRLTRTQTYKYLQQLISEDAVIAWYDNTPAQPRTYYQINKSIFSDYQD